MRKPTAARILGARGDAPPRAGRRDVVRGEIIDALAFRRVLGAFPTGVTIVATRWADGSPCGLTVSSFTSVSLDPPLILVCIDHASNTHDRLLESGSFAVSVLALHQAGLAARFALEPGETRFENLPWSEGPTGDPVVHEAAAWLACTLHAVHPGGDHSILVGRVEDLGLGDDEALTFYRGTYGRIVEP